MAYFFPGAISHADQPWHIVGGDLECQYQVVGICGVPSWRLATLLLDEAGIDA